MKRKAIDVNPEIMGGTPVFSGTRVPVRALFDYLESGDTLTSFLENFPGISKKHAIEVLQIARKSLTREKNINEGIA